MRLVGLVLISACWQQPASSPMTAAQVGVTIESPDPSRAISPPRRQLGPYAEVAGTWKGVGYQYDTHGHWELEMTLSKRGEIGDVIGTIAYENGGCTAELIREPERGDMLVMKEKLVTGQGKCVDNGTIRIPRRPTANELDWRWDFSTGTEGASSTIKRQ